MQFPRQPFHKLDNGVAALVSTIGSRSDLPDAFRIARSRFFENVHPDLLLTTPEGVRFTRVLSSDWSSLPLKNGPEKGAPFLYMRRGRNAPERKERRFTPRLLAEFDTPSYIARSYWENDSISGPFVRLIWEQWWNGPLSMRHRVHDIVHAEADAQIGEFDGIAWGIGPLPRIARILVEIGNHHDAALVVVDSHPTGDTAAIL